MTGGSGGIGLATCRALRRLGATVVVADVTQDLVDSGVAALSDGDGPDVLGVVVDVRDEGQARAAAKLAIAATGSLDVLVNCGGVSEPRGATLDKDMDAWQRVIDVNLTGTYVMSRATAEFMVPQRRGVVLNLASIASILGLSARPAYSASKAGVAMLTRTLACEWARYGVRVNAVAPGYILTPMTERLVAAGTLDVDVIARRTPMGRMGTPEEVADVLVMLADDSARFITGAVLPVDGGYMAVGAPGDAWEPVDAASASTL
ncbi:MAG: SDR family NAD(P)-dependent oxidoreductase [Pseudonocardia sp.]